MIVYFVFIHVKSIIRFYVFDIYVSLHHLSLKPKATNEEERSHRILIFLSPHLSQELIFQRTATFFGPDPN